MERFNVGAPAESIPFPQDRISCSNQAADIDDLYSANGYRPYCQRVRDAESFGEEIGREIILERKFLKK